MKRFVLLATAVALLCGARAPEASARVWNVRVDGSGDVPTIQAAVDTAGPGDEILIHPGVYSWANQGTGTEFALVTFVRDVSGFSLRSTGGASSTILDAQGQGRVLYLMAYNDVSFEGFTIRGGEAQQFGYFDGGGIIAHLCPAVFTDCVITGNNATRHGGGMWCGGWSTMHFINCEFSNNTAEEGAGILYVNSMPTGMLSGCVIKNNRATYRGGGIFIYNNSVMFENTVVAGNTAGTLGGGLYTWKVPPTSSMTGLTVVNNTAGEAGGGIYIFASSDYTLDNSIVAFNSGDGISLDGTSSLTIGCCDVFGNGNDAIPASATDTGGNFSADPQFCGLVAAYDFDLDGGSPCAPGNHPDGAACGLIGALPASCGGVPVQSVTWGGIKALYGD